MNGQFQQFMAERGPLRGKMYKAKCEETRLLSVMIDSVHLYRIKENVNTVHSNT